MPILVGMAARHKPIEERSFAGRAFALLACAWFQSPAYYDVAMNRGKAGLSVLVSDKIEEVLVPIFNDIRHWNASQVFIRKQRSARMAARGRFPKEPTQLGTANTARP